MWLDKSKINTYIACPFRFKLQYIDNVTAEETVELIRGKIFHQITYDYYENIDATKISNTDDIFNALMSLVEERYKPLFKDLFYNYSMYEMARLEHLRKFNKVEYFKPLQKELYLKDEAHRIEGTIDRLYKDADEGLVLVELKSGEYRPFSNSISAHKRELTIYSYLLQKCGYAVSKAVIYFAKNHRHIVYDTLDLNYVSVLNKVYQIREKIRQGVFTKNLGGLCRFCNYARICLANPKSS